VTEEILLTVDFPNIYERALICVARPASLTFNDIIKVLKSKLILASGERMMVFFIYSRGVFFIK
jgi:hypothetical protein